jgi:type I restriction enzyme S subunit
VSLPRYPEYKDSGVEWLGQVPAHWTVMPLGRISTSRCDGPFGSGLKSDHYTDAGIRVIRLQNIKSEGFDGTDAAYIDAGYYHRELGGHDVVAGDVLIAGLGDDRNTVGRACTAPADIEPAMVKADCFRYRIDTSIAAPEFVASALCAGADASAGLLSSGSTRSRISLSSMSSRRLAIPPTSEQHSIAVFLNEETAKIDALMAEQQRLIDLLKEKRQAVISHAVTTGLNHKVEMRPSGSTWIDEVPSHWEVGPLKRYWSVTDCKHLTADFVADGIPLASIREVQGRWVALEDARCTTEHFYELLIDGGRKPSPGDLIFSRNATVGEVAQVRDDHPRFAMGQDVVLLRKLNPKFSSDYFQHVIRSPLIIEQLANMMIGSTFKRINVEEIRSFIVPSPPPSEQVAIAEYLERELRQFDALTAAAQSAIDLLRERRAALISAAVTGQFDVRHLAPSESA